MEARTYNYLNEKRISIEASTPLLNRIQENIEEPPLRSLETDCLIRVSEPINPVTIVRDRNYPFASTGENRSRSYGGFDLFRYSTRVRTIWRKSNSEYEVETHTKLDEKAVLKCFKNFYFENSPGANFLLHAALVNVGHQGILITGKCRSGKTTLMQSMALASQAGVVSGGNTLISFENGSLIGSYTPRPFYIRFSGIVSRLELTPLLQDLESCNAIQYLDEEAIQRIICSRSFDVDGGLCISRRKYADLLSISTGASSGIDKIVFTQYSPNTPRIKTCTPKEALNLLKSRVLPKKTDLFKLEETSQIIPPNIRLNSDLIRQVKLIKLSFAGGASLTKSLLEDIVSIGL